MQQRVSGRATFLSFVLFATSGAVACNSEVGYVSPLVAGDGAAAIGNSTDAGATGTGDATGTTGSGGRVAGSGGAISASGGNAGSVTPPAGGTTGSGATTGSASGGVRGSGGTGMAMSGAGGTTSSGGATSTTGTGGSRVASGGATASGGKTGTSGSGGAAAPAPMGCPDDPAAGVTIYYACDCGAGADKNCTAGKDSNDGKSPSTPWQTFEKARSQFASLKAGDRIEFCQGGSFTEGSSNSFVNKNCKAGNRCVVTSYQAPWASGDEGRPVIHVPSGANGIDFTDANEAHEEGYVFAGIELAGGGMNWGFFFYNDISDVLVCNVAVHDFEIGLHTAGGNTVTTHNERITIRNSTITNNNGQGFLGCDNGLDIESNHFENNGYARAILNHNIYLSGGGNGVSGVTIRNNELYKSTLTNGQCTGTSLVAHGLIDNMLIEGNYVHEDKGAVDSGCWGIAIVPGYSSMELFTNITLRGNTVVNMGNTSLGVAACQKCSIENNVVINQQGNNYNSILAPAGDEGPEDAKDDQITIRNNSVLIDGGQGIGVVQEGKGNIIVNNAIYDGGAGNGGVACFQFDQPASSYTAIDHNVCFTNGKGEWVVGQGSLDTWSKKTGFDKNSALADPKYKSMASPWDLTPATGSPLLNAADASNCPLTNFAGATRTATPNIGAY